jgi:sulfate adenylyltransferase large subunit
MADRTPPWKTENNKAGFEGGYKMRTTINSNRNLLHVNTAGCVDNGKSTLIGRLRYDCGGLPKDVLDKLAHKSGENKPLNLAFITDGLKAEQERGITIDVARHFVRRDGLDIIIADTPGHQEFTRNMLTGTSNSNATLILVDATKGIVSQNRRHAYIASLMGVEQIIVLVNKMDLVGFSADKFNEIKSEFNLLVSQLNARKPIYIPVSALQGDNVVIKSKKMPWYHGESVIGTLEKLELTDDLSAKDLHFVVQWIDRISSEIVGTVLSGNLFEGDTVVALPENQQTEVAEVRQLNSNLSTASLPAVARIRLNDRIKIERGSILKHPETSPSLTDYIRATICWMDENVLIAGREYQLLASGRLLDATVFEIENLIDIESYERTEAARFVELNDIAEVKIKTAYEMPWELFRDHRNGGRFVLIDKNSKTTCAAGIVTGFD